MESPKRKKHNDDPTDRISELPQPILHHVLCFLSQSEATQTSVLSKSWRHLWCTRPAVEFRQTRFRGNNETFVSIFDQTLQRYHRQNLTVKQFIVDLSSADYDIAVLVEKWIDPTVLVNMGVETFHLIFEYAYYNYDMSSVPTFLKELYLQRCYIVWFNDKQLGLKHLQTLSLNDVVIEEGSTLDKIMASCPLIKRVDLIRCEGVKDICLFSSGKVEVNVPSALEAIKIKSCRNCYLYQNINNRHFPHLKSLYLSKVQLPENFFDSFLCNCPILEDLELRRCLGFSQVKILSRSIKRLIIVNTKKQIKSITIDAPGILYFEFSSLSSAPSISFATVASRKWISNISVPFQLQNSRWFLKLLNEVLKDLRQSRITLNLFYDTKRTQYIEGIINSHDPVVVEHLCLKGSIPSDDFAALFNCLFRFFRPSYINTRMYPNPQSIQHLEINKLSEFICKAKLKDEEFKRGYFWEQELKELSIEVLDNDSGQWCHVQGSSLPVCELKKITHTRFGFKWRESIVSMDKSTIADAIRV